MSGEHDIAARVVEHGPPWLAYAIYAVTSVVLPFAGWFGARFKDWMGKRKLNAEIDLIKAQRDAIVTETTERILAMQREEMASLRLRIERQEERILELESVNRTLRSEVDTLRSENGHLRRKLQELEAR